MQLKTIHKPNICPGVAGRWFAVALGLGTLALAGGCGSGREDSSTRLKVVATTTMVADMVAEVGGDAVTVAGLMGPGVDPHLYNPTASDVNKVASAKVIFFNGLMLEGKMAELFERREKQGKPVYAVTAKLPRDKLRLPHKDAEHADPHVWGDAELWTACIDVVVSSLSEIDPEHADGFEARGASLKERYLDLHRWVLDEVSQLPASDRVLITSHDAFGYFGRAYGFQVVGVQGISTDTQAGLADIAKTVDFIREHGVKAIFVESSVPRATVERISRDSGARIGGELFSDSTGAAGEMIEVEGKRFDKSTYEGMLRHNVVTVVRALKTSSP